jgi:hypothetical protein
VGKWKQATLEQQFASFINALQVGEGACAHSGDQVKHRQLQRSSGCALQTNKQRWVLLLRRLAAGLVDASTESAIVQ